MRAKGEGVPALVIIDVQRDFLRRAVEPARVARNCARLLAAARAGGAPVFHVRRTYRRDGLDVELPRLREFMSKGWLVAEGSPGARPPQGLEEVEGEIVVRKPRWSAFFRTELDLLLRRLGVGELYVAGLQTPNCVRATIYDAIALDYGVWLVEDATSARTMAVHRSNVRDMVAVGARVMSTAQACKALRGR
jgi:nicotinamidase-related amidase